MRIKRLALAFLVLSCALGAFAISPSADSVRSVSPSLHIIAGRTLMAKSVSRDCRITFSPEDFDVALGIDGLDGITVTGLPSISQGTLMLGDMKVFEGQRISRDSISELVFYAEDGVNEALFTFSPDGCSYSLKCAMYLLEDTNMRPTSLGIDESFYSLATYKNLACSGNMTAYDPENDALTFEVTSLPKHGLLVVNDRECGDYTYTPVKNYSGHDSFTYVATDKYGNRSEPITVSITVTASESGTVFTDMINSPDHYGAVLLYDLGIMSCFEGSNGRTFDPDSYVCAGELLVGAMKVLGIKPEKASVSYDGVPKEYAGYVSKALEIGAIVLDGNGAFKYDREITRAQACLLLSRLVETDTLCLNGITDLDGLSDGYREAVTVMASINVIDTEGGYTYPDQRLDRGGMARMLSALVNR